MLPKSSLKSTQKARATNITAAELLAYNLRACGRLAETVRGEYSRSFTEYLEYFKLISVMLCNYTHDSVLRFDEDNFRRTAKNEKVSLVDERYRKFLAVKYFYSDNRKFEPNEPRSRNQLFREKGPVANRHYRYVISMLLLAGRKAYQV